MLQYRKVYSPNPIKERSWERRETGMTTDSNIKRRWVTHKHSTKQHVAWHLRDNWSDCIPTPDPIGETNKDKRKHSTWNRQNKIKKSKVFRHSNCFKMLQTRMLLLYIEVTVEWLLAYPYKCRVHCANPCTHSMYMTFSLILLKKRKVQAHPLLLLLVTIH